MGGGHTPPAGAGRARDGAYRGARRGRDAWRARRRRGGGAAAAKRGSLDAEAGKGRAAAGGRRVGRRRAPSAVAERRGGVASFLASGVARSRCTCRGRRRRRRCRRCSVHGSSRRLHDATRVALRPRHRAAPIMAERRRASSTHAVKEAKAREHGCGRWSRIRRRTTLKRQRRSTARAKACKAARGRRHTRPLALAHGGRRCYCHLALRGTRCHIPWRPRRLSPRWRGAADGLRQGFVGAAAAAARRGVGKRQGSGPA